MQELPPILISTHNLVLWIYSDVLVHFPKKERFILGQQIPNQALKVYELMLRANSVRGKDRAIILQEVSIELDMLRMFMRLANQMRLLSNDRYEKFAKRLNFIGKMLGGWIKSCQ